MRETRHPMSEDLFCSRGAMGAAGQTSIACYDLICVYQGVSAHAGARPWDGVNALDAVVATYVNVSMLRQQIRPDERIHGAIMEAPKITNAIPAYAVTKYTVRSPTMNGLKTLGSRVRQCLEAGALATGCKVEIEESAMYADLRLNKPLCRAFQTQMGEQGLTVTKEDAEPMAGSTDQGNVSYALPSLHALVGISVADGSHNHTTGFMQAAGTLDAHRRTVKSGKAMAMTGWSVLVDEAFYTTVVDDFERDKLSR